MKKLGRVFLVLALVAVVTMSVAPLASARDDWGVSVSPFGPSFYYQSGRSSFGYYSGPSYYHHYPAPSYHYYSPPAYYYSPPPYQYHCWP